MSRQPPADVIAAAQASERQWKVPASISLAQWIIESGWGVHSPGNNPFGMKPRKGKNDPFQNLMTTEYYNGKLVHVPQPFRKFATITDAFMAHAELLATAPIYADAMTQLPDETAFIDHMAHHYATDPLYANKIKSLIASQRLDKYDKSG